MARTAVPVTPAPSHVAFGALSAVTFTAADIVNLNQVTQTGSEVLLVRNADGAAPHNVSITSAPDVHGRTKDLLLQAIPANGVVVSPRFPVDAWRQSDGNLYFSADSIQIQFAVIKLLF